MNTATHWHWMLQSQSEKFLSEQQRQDPALQDFLQAISKFYTSCEREKKLTEHAFEVSEKEYQALLSDLKQEIQLKQTSISKIKNAIRSLDADAKLNSDDDDLISVIRFLEDQVVKTKKLEEELLKAKELAESSSKAKSNFLSVMSHEIRTPLNAIIGFIHLLSNAASLPSQDSYLKAISISSENLLHLVNDILDFSKIEAGKIEFSSEKIDLRELLHKIKISNTFKAEERENKITLLFDDELPRSVLGDPVRLSQIMNNLVSNAVKFTHRGHIKIEVIKVAETERHYTFQFLVSDTGVGIPPEAKDKIFERFTQANSNIDRQYGGSGLGLAIVQKLLHMQGHDIQVESEPGKGSVFSFTLHFGKVADDAPALEPAEKPVQELSGMRVLLVEDVAFNRTMAKILLTQWNAEVDEAENGQIAVEKCQNHNYDVVLMDLQMPVMDGITATKKIRTFNPHLPIIALTASSSQEMQTEIAQNGLNDFVSKPFVPNTLFEKLAMLKNRGAIE